MIFIPKLQSRAEAFVLAGAGGQKGANRGQTSIGNIWTGGPVFGAAEWATDLQQTTE